MSLREVDPASNNCAFSQKQAGTPSMKSGGGVLLVSALQLIVGLIILFIYEGYK